MFENEKVKLDVLKKRAYNLRWAEVEEGVIPMTAADPDYPVAEEIKEAMIEYIQEGYFSYTPKLGFPSFKEAISKALYDRKKEEIPAEQILPIDSAARAMDLIAKAFLKEGDEMIVFDPCDYLFREACLQAKATPVFYPADLKDGLIDLSHLEDCVSEKTKMIGLCNPHNPYGKSYTAEQLDHLMKVAEKYDLYIMNDEIWSDIVYPDSQFTSIYCLGNERCHRVLSVFGFSKSFGLAGLRIGCMYSTDKANFDKMVEASQVLSTAGGISSLSQVAGEAAVSKAYYWVDEFVKHLQKSRDYGVDFINNEIPGLKAYRPDATYLLYVDMSAYQMTSAEFIDYLAKNVKLQLVPGGRPFFGDLSEGHFRICIATSEEILKEGLRRLKEGCAMLQEEKGLKF